MLPQYCFDALAEAWSNVAMGNALGNGNIGPGLGQQQGFNNGLQNPMKSSSVNLPEK